jgi:hypothetical protein
MALGGRGVIDQQVNGATPGRLQPVYRPELISRKDLSTLPQQRSPLLHRRRVTRLLFALSARDAADAEP